MMKFAPLALALAELVIFLCNLYAHIWNAQITYFCKRDEWQEVIKNPAQKKMSFSDRNYAQLLASRTGNHPCY